jgi:hypothetical protein
MRFHGRTNRYLIAVTLLAMLLAQSFSLHFHIGGDDADAHSHVHSHVFDSGHAGHLATDHGVEASAGDAGALVKQAFSLENLAILLTLLLLGLLPRVRFRSIYHPKPPDNPLPHFRPPLRAPPR